MPTTYKVGDQVLLSAKNIKTIRSNQKLDYRFLGLFLIIKKIRSQAYKLCLPPKYSRLHDVFHVSLLKPYTLQQGSKRVIIEPDLVKEEGEYEVEEILARRTFRNRKE